MHTLLLSEFFCPYSRQFNLRRLIFFRIKNSDINGEKAVLILKSLLKLNMKIIEFSNCKISDLGMIAVAKLILDVPVQEILLPNNQIGKLLKPVEMRRSQYNFFFKCTKLMYIILRNTSIMQKEIILFLVIKYAHSITIKQTTKQKVPMNCHSITNCPKNIS